MQGRGPPSKRFKQAEDSITVFSSNSSRASAAPAGPNLTRVRNGGGGSNSSPTTPRSTIVCKSGDNKQQVQLTELPRSSPAEVSPVATIYNLATVTCISCNEPLCPPIFQCQNNHIACGDCSKQPKWCPCSSTSTAPIRNHPMEAVVSSLILTCKNISYGCQEMSSVTNRKLHEAACGYTPFKCITCDFISPAFAFHSHLTDTHNMTSISILSFDTSFSLKLPRSNNATVIKVDKILFLLHQEVKLGGSILFMTFLGPTKQESTVSYHLSAVNGDDRLSIDSTPRSLTRDCKSPDLFYLHVPLYQSIDGLLKLEVCIRKK